MRLGWLLCLFLAGCGLAADFDPPDDNHRPPRDADPGRDVGMDARPRIDTGAPDTTPGGDTARPDTAPDAVAGDGMVPPPCMTDCDDGNPCTRDACDRVGMCSHMPLVGVLCDDANACTDNDTCDTTGTCTGTPKPPCASIGPTICGQPTCDPASGLCDLFPDHRVLCGTGDAYGAARVCDGLGRCGCPTGLSDCAGGRSCECIGRCTGGTMAACAGGAICPASCTDRQPCCPCTARCYDPAMGTCSCP